jgi:hypothetical protein
MTRPWPLALLLIAGGVASADVPPAAGSERVLHAGDSKLRIDVVDPPDRARDEELKRWAAEAAQASLAAFGRFPLPDATVRVEQIDSRDPSPVPWGQTMRRDGVSVYLFVRRNAGLRELRADWTAVHELSHLFHPYLGNDGRWLAEGLASYYQNVLRARAGLMTQADAWESLDAGFGRGRREDSGARLDELSRTHRGELSRTHRGTMRVYWAGAAFWLEADLALRREHGSSLDAILSRYSRCCLHGTGEVAPEAFVAGLDRIGGDGLFKRLFDRYTASREFPSLDADYEALGIQSGGDSLRFSDRPEAVRLRQAIMATRPGIEQGSP